jgi:hypothetical protein
MSRGPLGRTKFQRNDAFSFIANVWSERVREMRE